MDLNYTLVQMELTAVYRTFHPIAAVYIFFLSTHGTFSRKKKHMLGHKTSLSKVTRLKLYNCLSSCSGKKLEISNRKKTRKFTNLWRLKPHFWTTRGSKMKLKWKCGFKSQKMYWNKQKWKDNISKLLRFNKSSAKREVHSDKLRKNKYFK